MKNQRGITLVALVVTIIVLLILAGVGIYLTVGQNGIIARSKEAAKEHEQASIKQDIGMLMGEYALEEAENKTSIETFLNNKKQEGLITNWTAQDNAYILEKNGYSFRVDKTTLAIEEQGSSSPEEGVIPAGYHSISINAYIGKLSRQRASYLKTTVILEELGADGNPTGVSLEGYIGYDGSFQAKNNSNQAFLDKSFTMELKKEAVKTAYPSDMGTFSNVFIKGNVKDDIEYKITVKKTVSYGAGANVTDSLINVYEETLASSQTTKTLTRSMASIMMDFDNDTTVTSNDTIYFKSVFNTLSSQAITENSEKYISLMDEDGNPKPELEKYLGFDINKDGYIGPMDTTIMTMAQNGSY